MSVNIPDGQKIYPNFPIKGTPKITQIGIFGLKINHLATMHFSANAFYFSFSTHKRCILSVLYATALLRLAENLMPRRDSNPGLLFLRRMRRH
jgi:hypothetical protein